MEKVRFKGILLSEGTLAGDVYSADVLKKAVERLDGRQFQIDVEWGTTKEFGKKKIAQTTKISYDDTLKAILIEGNLTDRKALIQTKEIPLYPTLGASVKRAGPNYINDMEINTITLVKEPSCHTSYLAFDEKIRLGGASMEEPKVEEKKEEVKEKKEYPIPPLSELETNLLERFKTEKAIDIGNMNEKEKGALGKLAARGHIEKTKEPIVGIANPGETVARGTKMKTVWQLIQAKT